MSSPGKLPSLCINPEKFTSSRTAKDFLGTIAVPRDAYYGAQTQRALDNFPISGQRLPASFIRSLALIKKCAAAVNCELGRLPKDLADAVSQAAQEIVGGRLIDRFVVDVFQTGSGTSTHMNANEVIAGRANEILIGKRGGKSPVHPNDHVNLGQSSNDVIPTALHISALTRIRTDLEPALKQLAAELENKSAAFRTVAKTGRTHLRDAVPITLGQELEGYACQVTLGIGRLGEKCVAGMNVDQNRCAALVENSLALATLLTPAIGYDRAARLAQQARETGKTIREVVLEQGILSEAEFQKLLDRALP